MFPYVTAYSGATWNSPKCGSCVKLTSGGKSVFLTVIDQCGPPPAGNDAHFDIAPPAFRELFGDAGVNAGVQKSDWAFADSSNCQGNKGGSKAAPAPTTPKAAPKPAPSTKAAPKPAPSSKSAPKPGSTRSTTRCGSNWGDANTKCGTPCTTDGPCGGQRCYADLSITPCNRATEGEDSFFSADASNVEFVSEFTNDAAVADTETIEGDYIADSFVDTAVADNVEATAADFAADANAADFTVDTVVADPVAADAAVADFGVAGDFVAENVDAAVIGDVSSTTPQQQTQNGATTGMQGWMVAILVMFSITTVLLLAVVVLAVTILRKH